MEKMSPNTNSLNWFEIPATDLDRAKKFYEAIFDVQMYSMNVGGQDMAIFPSSPLAIGKVSGALVQSEMHIPSENGTVIYLNANPSIQLVIDRIEPNGGRIIVPKMLIDEQIGYMCHFLDTEGNRVGVHAGA